MDIKERFYTNLEMIREDYDSKSAKKGESDEYAAKSFEKASKTDPINSLWHKQNAMAFKKAAKKAKKRAVTGMDEEAEQLDEVSRKFALDKARKAEKKSYDYEDEGKRKSNMANSFGRNPKDADRLDRESEEAYKKSSKKMKQNWKFREYAAKKKMNEAEQLDELKRKTLADYIVKAHKDTNKQTLTLDNPRAPEKYAKVAERKFRNRNRGIERAARKLSK